ncbi:MAG: hypothetical protein Q9213_002744 [Squamulea squamosa]
MNTTSTEASNPGALLKIDDVGQSLINFTKLSHDPARLVILYGCYNSEQSLTAQCLQDIKKSLTATECSLYWCINRYSATQDSGVLEESVIDSWWSHSRFDLVHLNATWVEDKKVVSEGYHIQLLPPSDYGLSTSVHGQNLSQAGFDDIPRHASSQRLSTYDPCYVDLYTDTNLGRWLARFFTRGLNPWNTTGIASGEDELANAAMVLSGQNQPPSWKSSDIPRIDPVFDIFSNVASSLTSFVRLHRHNDWNFDKYPVQSWKLAPDLRLLQTTNHVLNFTAIGTVVENRTIVHFRWWWLSFPVGLVITTLALTIATKIRGSRRQVPVWGSSTAALMIRGPYSHTDEVALDLSAQQMHQKAQSTKVTLERGINGSWRLFEKRDSVTQSTLQI